MGDEMKRYSSQMRCPKCGEPRCSSTRGVDYVRPSEEYPQGAVSVQCQVCSAVTMTLPLDVKTPVDRSCEDPPEVVRPVGHEQPGGEHQPLC